MNDNPVEPFQPLTSGPINSSATQLILTATIMDPGDYDTITIINHTHPSSVGLNIIQRQSSQTLENILTTAFTWPNSLILFSFSLIIIISLCGNLLVCRTLIAQKRLLSNSTNVLIGVLAISDLIMTTFNIPFTVVDIILKDWIFGSFFCTLVSFVQANSVYVSSFTMAIIAGNRWKIIYKSLPKSTLHSSTSPLTSKRQQVRANGVSPTSQHRHSKWLRCCFKMCCRSSNNSPYSVDIEMEPNEAAEGSRASTNQTSRHRFKSSTRTLMLVFFIWFLAALHSLPHTIFNQVMVINVEDASTSSFISKRRCIPIWPRDSVLGDNFNLVLTLFTTFTQYFIPLSCAGVIYTRIGLTIASQGKVGQITKSKSEQLSKKKRRRLLMLVLIVAIFALCWLPFNVYYLLLDFGITESTNYNAFLFCLWLATSSVCYNPFVYCWLNDNFQREARNVIQKMKKCCPFC